MTFAQQPVTETMAVNLANALCSMGIPAAFRAEHTRNFLAKVETPEGLVCIYANAKGETKCRLHEIREPQGISEVIDRAWTQITNAQTDAPVPTAAPEPAGVVIYTDGSYLEDGFASGTGYAFVVLQDGERAFQRTGPAVSDGSRNVAGELEAVIQALTLCLEMGWKTPLFKHDYEGVAHFATGAWKAKQANSIRYRKAVQQYRELGISPTFLWVRGHSDTYWNNVVDELAKTAARQDLSKQHGSRI